MNNSSAVNVDGSWLGIEQGPTWLVQLLYDPHRIVFLLAVALLLVVAVAAGYAVHRLESVDQDLLLEIGENLAIAIGTLVATWVAVQWFQFSYVVDVLVGVSCGYTLGILFSKVTVYSISA